MIGLILYYYVDLYNLTQRRTVKENISKRLTLGKSTWSWMVWMVDKKEIFDIYISFLFIIFSHDRFTPMDCLF